MQREPRDKNMCWIHPQTPPPSLVLFFNSLMKLISCSVWHFYPFPVCMLNRHIGRYYTHCLAVHTNPECAWWVLSIWNLVIISARAKDLEGGWKRSLEALTNILNQEMLGCVLSWLIYPVAFQKAHGCWKGLMCTPFFFPSSLPACWSQIPKIFVACCDTTSTVSFTEKYWYKKERGF